MAIKEMNDIKKDTKKTDDFVKGADLKKGIIKSKAGRPKKSEEDRATEQIFTNVTPVEKERIEAHAKKIGISVSALVKVALAREGIL